MSKLIQVTEGLGTYVDAHSAHETPAMIRCREETQELPMGLMQISPDQGAFMALLAKLIGAKRYLEVGTFTGYSALAVASAMPADGKAVCLDVSKDFTDKARGYWKQAGLESQIELRLGPAVESMDAIIAAREPLFDFCFIDADKPNYDAYYERALILVRAGGLIAIDNMLWSGAVADPEIDDAFTRAIRALNDKVHGDPRVDAMLATIGDGIMLARKK